MPRLFLFFVAGAAILLAHHADHRSAERLAKDREIAERLLGAPADDRIVTGTVRAPSR